MEGSGHAATVPRALQCSLIALRGSLFDASVVAFLRRPCWCITPPYHRLVVGSQWGRVGSGEMGALGGDVCARVVESMWRWSLVDDRTLPVVASLSAHFTADWHGHLPLTYHLFSPPRVLGPASLRAAVGVMAMRTETARTSPSRCWTGRPACGATSPRSMPPIPGPFCTFSPDSCLLCNATQQRRVDDDFLECLGESPAAGTLQELNLSECVGITTEGLRALRAFPRLR